MSLSDKVAVVTGAAQGIGRAIAERFAKDGARVIIADINENKGAAVADAIVQQGYRAKFIQTNVTQQLDIHNMVALALETYGSIDVMVCNAAIVDTAPFLDLGENEFERVLSTNLKGAFLCGQAAAKQMVSQLKDGRPPGTIVNMSSVNAFFGLPDHVAYTASKGGIMQLTRAMAIALAPHGIRVNAIGPGSIETPMLATVVADEAARERVLSRTPLGRFGQPEEIAAIAAWLASDEASYITGQTIYADGGRLPLNYVMTSQD